MENKENHHDGDGLSTTLQSTQLLFSEQIWVLNSQNDKFNKESYDAEDKYFCHYLGPRFIKLLYGLDFNYDTT